MLDVQDRPSLIGRSVYRKSGKTELRLTDGPIDRTVNWLHITAVARYTAFPLSTVTYCPYCTSMF